MAALPQQVIEAWEQHTGPVVLTTVSAAGIPNSIYATCVGRFDAERIVVADNYFDKTRANIKAGSYGSLLFIVGDDSAYQIKGRLEYHTSGPVFDDMKSWNPEKHPGHAAVAIVAEEVYSGAERLL